MRNMFNTDFKKLVALILVCFLLTNLWITFAHVRTVDTIYKDINFYHTVPLQLRFDKLEGKLCIHDDRKLNFSHCEKFRQSVPGK